MALGRDAAADQDLEKTPFLETDKRDTTHIPYNTLHFPSPQRLLALPLRVLQHALQSFKSTQLAATAPKPPVPGLTPDAATLSPTLWIDGLRGLSCIAIFVSHHGEWAHSEQTALQGLMPYGHDGKYYILNLPFLQLFPIGAHLALYLFFVISGYALAFKPLQHIHAGRHSSLATNVGSSLFRRWPRLFLPVIMMNFIWVTSWHVFGIASPGAYEPIPGLLAEWWRLWDFTINKGAWQMVNTHVWAVPAEFQGGVLVLATLMATCSFSIPARLATGAALCAYRLYNLSHDCAFLGGMLICEVHLLAQADRLPRWITQWSPTKEWKALWYVPLVLGLHLFTFSHNTDEGLTRDFFSTVPGSTIGSIFWPLALSNIWIWFRFWSAVLVFISIPHIPWFKRLCEWWPVLYLGQISFAVYLVHGPLLWSIGIRLYTACGLQRYEALAAWENLIPIPAVGPNGMQLPFVLPLLVMLAITIPVAHYFARLVELVSLRGVNRVYGIMLKK